MAAMKFSKETPASRRGIDPPSSYDAAASSPAATPVARTSSVSSPPVVSSSSSSTQPGMRPMMFPVLHLTKEENEKTKHNSAPPGLSSASRTFSPRGDDGPAAAATTKTRIAMDASFISTAPSSPSSPTRSAGGGGGSMIKAFGGTSPTAVVSPSAVHQQPMQTKQHDLALPPPPTTFLRSSMHTSSANTGPNKKNRKTVRYAFVQIYEHDLEKEARPGTSAIGEGTAAAVERVQSYELTEYEAQRGPRRPPKFFQKSDQERQGLRKLREFEELKAEQEWRQIRQETISIQEEVSFMSAPGGGGGDGDDDYFDSNQSVKSEASSFANASFYEGFEDRFKVRNKKKKKSPSLGSRFGRIFSRKQRFNSGGRPTDGVKSMIGEL